MEGEDMEQTDQLMRVRVGGVVQTLFGRLDQQRVQKGNRGIRYTGDINILEHLVNVSATYVHGGSNRPSYEGLGTALAAARENNAEVSGIIHTGDSGLDYIMEGIEGWQSIWQPYVEEN